MPSSDIANAAAFCVLLPPAKFNRIEAGAIHWLSSRPLGKVSILCAADRNGRHDVYFTENDPDDAGLGPHGDEDDDHNAGYIYTDVFECFERLEPVFSLQ